MREPTEKEMILGISDGMYKFLQSAHPFGPLGPPNLSKLIEKAINDAVLTLLKEKSDATGIPPNS